MKTQKKNQRDHYLQTRNNRWKWMAGATAAGVTASQASLVTVTLTNNYLSFYEGNHLNADLTGDGHPDLTIANARVVTTGTFCFPCYKSGYAKADLNGVLASWRFSAEETAWALRLGSQYTFRAFNYPPNTLAVSIPIFFKDLRINSGAPTGGSLEVTVSPFMGIQLDSFTYNSTIPGLSVNSVPEQGSGLALLAMGAGGILAFRRWRATQQRS